MFLFFSRKSAMPPTSTSEHSCTREREQPPLYLPPILVGEVCSNLSFLYIEVKPNAEIGLSRINLRLEMMLIRSIGKKSASSLLSTYIYSVLLSWDPSLVTMVIPAVCFALLAILGQGPGLASVKSFSGTSIHADGLVRIFTSNETELYQVQPAYHIHWINTRG